LVAARKRTETPAEHEDPQEQTTAEAVRLPVRALPPRLLRRQNQLLALLLAGVALFGFVTVFSLVLLLHYVETHHLLANL
jgi:hypothetical protein